MVLYKSLKYSLLVESCNFQAKESRICPEGIETADRSNTVTLLIILFERIHNYIFARG